MNDSLILEVADFEHDVLTGIYSEETGKPQLFPGCIRYRDFKRPVHAIWIIHHDGLSAGKRRHQCFADISSETGLECFFKRRPAFFKPMHA